MTTKTILPLILTTLLVLGIASGVGTQHASATMTVHEDPRGYQHHHNQPLLLFPRTPTTSTGAPSTFPSRLLRRSAIRASPSPTLTSTPLPSTILGGYTYCRGTDMCEVAASGTTLKVDAMTKAAALAGNASAVFETYGLTFQGTLSIDCFTGTPMGNGARLTVLIANGSSVATVPLLQIIVIRGALGIGSSVSIVGGIYNYVGDGASLLLLNGGLAMSAASSVSISSAKIIHSNTILNGSSLFFVRCAGGGDLTMSGGSTFKMENNNFEMQNVFLPIPAFSAIAVLPTDIVQWVLFQVDGGVVMSGNSELSFGMNRFDISNVSGWALQILHMNITIGVQLSTSSHIKVNDNLCDAKDLNLTLMSGTNGDIFAAQSLVVYVSIVYNGLYLVDSSTLSISNNVMLLNTSAITTFSYRVLSTSQFSINGAGCEVSVSSNTFHASRFPTYFWARLTFDMIQAYVSPLTVENGGAVTVTDNSQTVEHLTVTYFETNLLTTSVSAVYITGGGAVSLSHNAIRLLNLTVPSMQINGFVSYLGPLVVSGPSSKFDVSFNQLTLSDIDSDDMLIWLFRLETYNNITQISDGSTLSISNNEYEMENVSASSSFQWNPIYTSAGDYDFVVTGQTTTFQIENNFAVGNVDVSFEQETPPQEWRFSILNMLIIDTTLLVIKGATMNVAHNHINVVANYTCTNTSNTTNNVVMEAVLMRLTEVSDAPSMSSLTTTTTSTPSPVINISTCRNYASGKQCHIVMPQPSNSNISYDCLVGDGADRVGVHECTYTPTDTISRTVTLSVHRNSRTFSLAPPTTTSAPCDEKVLAQRRSEVPLFTATLSPEAVQSGSTTTMQTISPLNATISLLLDNNLTTGLTGITYTLVRKSVAGNVDGFSSNSPNIKVTVLNTSAVQIDLSALPEYSVFEGESLDLYVPNWAVEGVECGSGTMLLIGQIHVVMSVKIGASPSAVTTTIVSGGAVAAGMAGGMAGMAAEQQGLSAVVMFNCADPKSRDSFGSYRALSPFAIFESYAGVVLGNAIAVVGVALTQMVVLGVMGVCRPVQRLVQHMAASRFPNFTFNVAFTLHTGTAFAASQLISVQDEFESWEVAVGGIAFAYTVLFPVFLMLHPYLRIERAYQEYEYEEWFSQRKWPAIIRFLVPRGSIYSPETRRAFGSYISSYRMPATQVWWTSFPTWTSTVVGIGGLFHPDSVVGCQALFGCLGLVFLILAVWIVWCRPLRSPAACFLNAVGKVLMALVLFSLVSSLRGDVAASTAVVAFGILQTIATVMRLLHAGFCFYFDFSMTRDDVGLTTVWSHIPGESRKQTQVFGVSSTSKDLQTAASTRDVGEGSFNAPGGEGSDTQQQQQHHQHRRSRSGGEGAGGGTKEAPLLMNRFGIEMLDDEDGGGEMMLLPPPPPHHKKKNLTLDEVGDTARSSSSMSSTSVGDDMFSSNSYSSSVTPSSSSPMPDGNASSPTPLQQQRKYQPPSANTNKGGVASSSSKIPRLSRSSSSSSMSVRTPSRISSSISLSDDDEL